jgi:predicted RNA-binding protein with PUA-like domain
MALYWLMKSEPGSYSLDDLERDGSTCWEGVRNYQARNLMREMQTGDLVLFYHSNADPPGAVGIAQVEREAYPDHFSWDPDSRYFDPKSSPEEPRWWMVDLRFVERFDRFVPLAELKADSTLAGMLVTGRSRLSVQPVDAVDFETVVRLGVERS